MQRTPPVWHRMVGHPGCGKQPSNETIPSSARNPNSDAGIRRHRGPLQSTPTPRPPDVPPRDFHLLCKRSPHEASFATTSPDLRTRRCSDEGDELARSVGDEELLEWSTLDLHTLFGIRVDPVDHHVQRWIDAMPQYGPGHLDLIADLRAGLPPGLAVAGGYLDGIGVPACVAAATRAAASLLTPRVAR